MINRELKRLTVLSFITTQEILQLNKQVKQIIKNMEI